jgi:hypothetical protein
MQKLKSHKGKPEYHLLPPFATVQDDPRWEIPTQQKSVQQIHEEKIQMSEFEHHRLRTQSDIIKILQNVEHANDTISMKSKSI